MTRKLDELTERFRQRQAAKRATAAVGKVAAKARAMVTVRKVREAERRRRESETVRELVDSAVIAGLVDRATRRR